MTSAGGIVLCGGDSTRMGASKAMLPFGPETMVGRVLRVVSSVVSPVVLAAAQKQQLPSLPHGVIVARDHSHGHGPLEGLRAAWRRMPAGTDIAFVTGCDVPLLNPQFIARMVDLLAGYEIAVPEIDGFIHPLAGVYRRETLGRLEALLARRELRMIRFLELARTRRVQPDEIADIDPHFLSLRSLNTRDAYIEALRQHHLLTT